MKGALGFLAAVFTLRAALGVLFQAPGAAGAVLVPAFGMDWTQFGTLVGLFWLPGLVIAVPLGLVAPRAARVDSLPYRLGDQAPVGAPLAILLAGDAPYARIYVPVQQRVNVRVGDAIAVWVTGRDKPYAGKVRMIRSEPTFTPYYALIGDDAARLSYLAEVALGADAASLPVGLPVRVEFTGASR